MPKVLSPPMTVVELTATPTPASDAARKEALDRALSQIERAFGKGSIMRLEHDPTAVVPGISTGSIHFACLGMPEPDLLAIDLLLMQPIAKWVRRPTT